MIGTSFQNIGADNSLNVQEIKASGLTGLDWSFATTAGDTLQIWDANSQMYQTTFYYAGDAYDEGGVMETFGATPGSWFDTVTFAPAETEIPAGGAFWILSSGSGTLTFK